MTRAIARVHELDDDDETCSADDLDRARQAVAHAEQASDLAEIGIRRAQRGTTSRAR